MSLTGCEQVLAFDDVSKVFNTRSGRSLAAALLHRDRRRQVSALKGVTFRLPPGRVLAVVGANGAGKSTLLRLAVGASAPTSGTVSRQGSVAPVLELGAGFHPALSGRENALLNSRLLGLTAQQAKDGLDRVLAFAELEEVANVPLAEYSAGMLLRLGFSVAVHTDPVLLAVDEVLAVGDLAFQLKCLARVRAMRADGTAVLFASHVLSTVREIADEVVWLHNGVVRAHGAPRETLRAYETAAKGAEGSMTRNDVTVRLIEGGEDQDVQPGSHQSVRVEINIQRELAHGAQLEFRLRRLDLGVLAAWGGGDLALPALPRGGQILVRTRFTMAVADGRHYLDAVLTDSGSGAVLAEAVALSAYDVRPRQHGSGIVDVSPECNIEVRLD